MIVFINDTRTYSENLTRAKININRILDLIAHVDVPTVCPLPIPVSSSNMSFSYIPFFGCSKVKKQYNHIQLRKWLEENLRATLKELSDAENTKQYIEGLTLIYPSSIYSSHQEILINECVISRAQVYKDLKSLADELESALHTFENLLTTATAEIKGSPLAVKATGGMTFFKKAPVKDVQLLHKSKDKKPSFVWLHSDPKEVRVHNEEGIIIEAIRLR